MSSKADKAANAAASGLGIQGRSKGRGGKSKNTNSAAAPASPAKAAGTVALGKAGDDQGGAQVSSLVDDGLRRSAECTIPELP